MPRRGALHIAACPLDDMPAEQTRRCPADTERTEQRVLLLPPGVDPEATVFVSPVTLSTTSLFN